MTRHAQAAGRTTHGIPFLPKIAALAAALWLLLPAAHSVHLEQFTAHLQSMGRLLASQGSLDGYDIARPLIGQFIFFTRPGVVDLLAAMNLAFGYRGDAAFRLLVGAGLALLLLASAGFAHRFARVSFPAALFGCILVPGLVEIGYYFNDNVVSAGFAAAAFAALTLSNPTLAAILAGFLTGWAVLCRMDAVLAAPLILLLFVLREQGRAARILRIVSMAGAALAVHLLAGLANHVDLFDSLRITRIFSSLHGGGKTALPGIGPLVYFIGPVAGGLVAFGACLRWRSRGAGWRGHVTAAALHLYPALLALLVLRVSTESRYYLALLGPVLAVHAGTAIETLTAWSRGTDTRRRRLARAAAGLAAALLVAPPALHSMRDGPRVLVGRIWSPLFYMRWQEVVGQSMSGVQKVVEDLARQPVATLVSTHFNDEYYLRMRLFEAGYREAPAGPGCGPLSRYVRDDGGGTVWHLRLFPAYQLPDFPPPVSAAFPLVASGACAPVRSSGAYWLTTFGPVLEESTANGILSSEFRSPQSASLGWTVDAWLLPGSRRELGYRVFAAEKIDRGRFDRLVATADGIVAAESRKTAVDSATMMERFEATYRAR